MSIKVTNDANNGTVTIKGAEVAGDYTVTTPAFATELAPRMQLMTAQNSTSGTSIDFTGIPSWVKKITVMFNGVSTAGASSHALIRLGSGTIQITGYSSLAGGMAGATGILSQTTGFGITNSTAIASTFSGSFIFSLLSNNIWCMQGICNQNSAQLAFSSGAVTLSGTLDRIQVTTVNGTDTFDAGQIGVLYEG